MLIQTTVVLYQQARWTTVPSVAHTGSQTDSVEQCASPVFESHSCPRSTEQRCRLTLQRQFSLRRIETSPRGIQSDLGTLWLPRSRFVCLEVEQSVPHVLSLKPGGTNGDRCACTRVATGSALCISLSGPDPTHVSQGVREGLDSHPDSPSLAKEALAGRHYPAP